MSYYLNAFNAVVKGNKGYEFPGLDLKNNEFKFDDKQEGIFKKLLNREFLEKNILEEVFGVETITNWIDNKILITMPIDEKNFYSRSMSYYWHKKMGNIPAILPSKSVLIMGCGGIGSHVAWNLTTLGVGTIYIVDYDVVEISNLNRQLLYDMDDVGKYKVDVLKEKLQKINPFIKIEAINQKISSEVDLKELILKCSADCLVKALDSPIYFPKWLDKVCKETNTKYVSGIMTKTAQMIGPTYIPNVSANYTEFFESETDKERISGIGPSLSFVMYQISGQISEEVFKVLIGRGKLQYKNRIVIYENLSNEIITLKPKNVMMDEPKGNYKWYNLINFTILVLIYFIGVSLSANQLWIIGVALTYALIEPVWISQTKLEAFTYAFINIVYMMLCNMFVIYSKGGFAVLERSTILSFISLIYMFLSIFILILCLIEIGLFNLKKYSMFRRRKRYD